MTCKDCQAHLKVRGIRRLTQTRCSPCYQKSRHKAFCKDCGIKRIHSTNIRCAKCFSIWHSGERNGSWKGGLPKCKKCERTLSVYLNSSQYDTGLCQGCYKGAETKRWNPKLLNEDRMRKRSILPGYTDWRISVFERDGYSCQKCGDNKGGNLVAHHLDNWKDNPEKRLATVNGITLCSDCHRAFHNTYGYLGTDSAMFSHYVGDGATTKTLGSAYSGITVQSDGANWIITSLVGTVT